MKCFLVGCLLGTVLGLLLNIKQTSHGPLYPALDVAVWTLIGALSGLTTELWAWLAGKTTAKVESRPHLRALGIRLLLLGTLMFLLVALKHADVTNGSRAYKDETWLIPPLLAGGVIGITGAVLWYIVDRKN